MTALYEIAAAYRADVEKLADLDLDEQTIADTLDGLGGELEVKAQNVVMFTRNLEATAAAIKEAEGQMAKRRKAIENRVEGLRRYTLTCMQAAGVEKIECPLFEISIRQNPPAVEIFDDRMVPAEFMSKPEPPPPAPVKDAIKSALKAGQDVPGCRLTQSFRLEVK